MSAAAAASSSGPSLTQAKAATAAGVAGAAGAGATGTRAVVKVPTTLKPQKPLLDLDSFASLHSKYPACIVTIYQIMRDLHIKQEMIDLELVDASKWGRLEYFIEGKTRSEGKKRLLAPFYLDAEIDLPWLSKLSLLCQDQQQELYLCIHTPETVIYEMVTTELP